MLTDLGLARRRLSREFGPDIPHWHGCSFAHREDEKRSLKMDAMNLAKNDAAMTAYSLMQGIEALIRKIWFLPGDAEEAEIENYATKVLKCVTIGDSINNLELILGQIQTNRLQQPYTQAATRDLAERAFALITNANLNTDSH
jgi:hypothetical protein